MTVLLWLILNVGLDSQLLWNSILWNHLLPECSFGPYQLTFTSGAWTFNQSLYTCMIWTNHTFTLFHPKLKKKKIRLYKSSSENHFYLYLLWCSHTKREISLIELWKGACDLKCVQTFELFLMVQNTVKPCCCFQECPKAPPKLLIQNLKERTAHLLTLQVPQNLQSDKTAKKSKVEK